MPLVVAGRIVLPATPRADLAVPPDAGPCMCYTGPMKAATKIPLGLDPFLIRGRHTLPENRWETRPAVHALAEQLRGLTGKGVVLVVDKDSFSIKVPEFYALPAENRDAEKGAEDHWITLDDRTAELGPPKIEDADMPDDLIAALGLLLGFGSESV